MAQARIAVVTTVLNERQGIRELLDGFVVQTRRADQIVVVDGGSTDGTLEALNDYRASHPEVVVLVSPGVNIARGRNIGIAHADADIIAVTDGGCRPEAQWLERLVQPLLDDPSYAAVTGARRIVAANRFERFAGLLSTSTNAPREEERVFHGRNSAFRKSLWEAVGGYPEWLYTAEDTLFARRAKALGARVALAESAVVSWRPRPTLRKLAKQYFLYGRGNGRVQLADLRAARYHLRNHALWLAPLLASPLFPPLLLVSAAVLIYLYITLLRPAIASARQALAEPHAAAYVGAIVMVRSFFNNLGQVFGAWEYRHTAGFRENLEAYWKGTWQRADLPVS